MNETERQLLEYIDGKREELFALLSELITFDTQNFITHGNEENCREFVAGRFRQAGLDTECYYPDQVKGIQSNADYLSGRGTDRRPNITGLLKGSEGKKRVMLAAHTDTMPIGDKSLWSVDPLGGLIRDNRIYGKGAGDNKCGIAAGVVAVGALRALGITLKNDVALTAYCDEEYGGGNGSLAACLKYPSDVFVNLDGGNYELWTCSMGGCMMRADIKAEEPQDSAELVADGLELLRRELKGFEEKRRKELHEDKYFTGSDMERSAFRILGYHAGNSGAELDRGYMEFVFYTNKTRFEIEYELNIVKSRVAKQYRSLGLAFTSLEQATRFFHCLKAPEDDQAVAIMKECAETAGERSVKITGACLSDLSLYLRWGSVSSFNFGIFRDFKRYGGAHQADEFVDCDEFVSLTKALALFLYRWDQANL